MAVYSTDVYDVATGVRTVTLYDLDTVTVTVTVDGDVTETRPMTPEEVEQYGYVQAAEVDAVNTAQMVAESDEAVDKLTQVVNDANAITDLTNAEINANVAPILKDVTRLLKTVARQANREARLTSGRTESTDTGEVIDE